MTAKPSELAQVPRRRRIRRARATDAAAIAALVDSAEALRQVSPLEAFPLDRATVLHWLLQRDAGHVLEDRGEIEAYGELVPDARSADRLWIGHMIVHPRRRGLGIGQRLVQELLRVAEHEHGAREVAISAFADNERALRCYEACGFVRVDEERVDGRLLVGLRHRFAARTRSPRTLTLLATGWIALGAGVLAFLVPARELVESSPAALASVAVQPAAALLAFPLRRERRQTLVERWRAAALRASIANGAALVCGAVILATTNSAGQAGWLAGIYASATLVWVALLGLVFLAESRG